MVPERDPAERSRDFEEVVCGYNEEQAVLEATRCLQCKHKPCVQGCPVQVDIPAFINLIKTGKFAEAAAKIKEANALPAICGRVCPQENQCEGACTLSKAGMEPVNIGALERFAADRALQAGDGKAEKARKTGFRVAVVGSGPASITAAAELAQKGHDVVVFEALHEPGGVLSYGIPEFRLPKVVVGKEIERIKALGVEIRLDVEIGRTISLQDLFDRGFDAIFIGVGAGLPRFLNIPGENLVGVLSANELLTRVNLMKAYRFPETDTPVQVGRKVVVVGGGNTALDAARTARRLGAEVVLIYRRSREEMPARLEEVKHAEAEGIQFRMLVGPVQILGDDNNRVVALECIRMELGPEGKDGRRRPVPVVNSEFTLPVDTVIVAIGQGPNPLLARDNDIGLAFNEDGTIVIDESTGATSIAGVFAGGDITTGGATVIESMGAGKRAASGIHAYLSTLKNVLLGS